LQDGASHAKRTTVRWQAGADVDYRTLGSSGLNVPVIGLGTANFRGGSNPANGLGDKAAARLIDLALDRGAALFDTSDIYPGAEETLGKALAKRRAQAMIVGKLGLRNGPGINDVGATRHHLVSACEASLRRLGTDHLDLLVLHAHDARNQVEETLAAFDMLIRSGKARAVGASNHAGWQLMKALAAADRNGLPRYCAHQIAWSLAMRDAEWELIPLAADQNVATMAWGPLGAGALSGRYGRGGLPFSALPYAGIWLGSSSESRTTAIVDCLGEIARETGSAHAPVALAWLLQRPTLATIVVGANDTAQLEQNLGALELRLSGDQLARLDEVSALPPPFPHYLQLGPAAERNPRAFPPPANVRIDPPLGG
jgi:aryl-alcohol dehydrogenase-like predicted oxidoreductase